jgi:competence protein ComGC
MDSGKWIMLLVGLIVILLVSALAICVVPAVKRRIQQWGKKNIADRKMDQQLSELELMHQGYTIWPSDASEEQKDQALDDLRNGKPYQFYPPKQVEQEED